ncbi:glucose-1-phosphate adenylyltransferase [Streptomyces sp. NP160]|uniref:glucose-1-phosphate adenylyltransferase family protein n=1 Tax=Streptomyces sp. NP160 TaxID=2586637 RepID=UPI00111A8950|nr:sugar phosphate nucleotidyltransferase [Streptomyces sp. NP160]TNM67146.1 glucose-1-phosphate adenylyltransferase [Streptomyces sp. NP160]
MAPPRVLALVLAGGAGSRLELLTEHRAKGAVPVAGTHRLVDFALSSCAHSGISDVWVSVQFHPASLAHHLANGRPWDLDRTGGGLVVLPPHRGTPREGWHTGTADSQWRNADLVRQHDPEVLLVMSSDSACTLDLSDVVEDHLGSGAEATMVVTRVAHEEASRYGVVEVEEGPSPSSGPDEPSSVRVRRYEYKPEEPRSDLVTTEVFAFAPRQVLDRLEELARAVRRGDDDAGDDDGGLGDLGHALLPGLAADGAARTHPQRGYWRDLGTVPAYWTAHQELLGPEPPLDLDDPAWPVLTRGGRRGPARVMAGARVEHSLVSPGAVVAGELRGSVLCPGAVVEEGAQVLDSVLLPGARVLAGARVERAIVDDGVVVGRGARVGGPEDITLLGGAVRVHDGAHLPAGSRLPEPQPGR